jgi:alpha-glucoside transport system ATP-binding protein
VATRIEIAQLKESMPNSTMVYVTHDQVEAMTLASRIVVLANRGIAQVGTPLQLYEQPENEFVAQFIGSPAMNLLPGEIVETGNVTKVKLQQGGGVIAANIETGADKQGTKVNVGIRPEDMMTTDSENYAFEGKVAISEALGEVTQVYFSKPQSGEAPVIAKLPGVHRDVRNQAMRMTADPSKLHLFADGRSLLYH